MALDIEKTTIGTIPSNPTVSFDNLTVVENQPQTVRDFWSKNAFFHYKPFQVEKSSVLTGNTAPDVNIAGYSWSLEDAGMSQPNYIDDINWEQPVKLTASAFLNGKFALMPRLIQPTIATVANGINGKDSQSEPQGGTSDVQFNWDITGTGLNVKRSGSAPNYTVSILSKDDAGTLLVVADLQDSNSGSHNMVGGNSGLGSAGAFSITVNRLPAGAHKATKDVAKKRSWRMDIEFGECLIELTKGGSMRVSVADTITEFALPKNEKSNSQLLNLPNSMNITVYPVWNGIIVSSGIIDNDEAIKEFSYYCPKNKDANIADYMVLHDKVNQDTASAEAAIEATYQSALATANGLPSGTPAENTAKSDAIQAAENAKTESLAELDDEGIQVAFDVDDPKPIEVEYREDVAVDMGESVSLWFEGIIGEFMYTPLFFSDVMKVTTYMMGMADKDNITNEYVAFPIWTKNGVDDAELALEEYTWTPADGETPAGIVDAVIGEGVPDAGSPMKRFGWQIDMPGEMWRIAPELFGFILLRRETSIFNIPNSNGEFDMSVLSPHVQAVNAQISKDNISGSITVDAFALDGQPNTVEQQVGSVTINVDDVGRDQTGGQIFGGLAFGTGLSGSSDSDTYTVQLVSLSQKLEDMSIINAPFFDGMKYSEVMDWISAYGGFSYEFHGDDTQRCPASVDFTTPILDFRMGTGLRDVLNQLTDRWGYDFIFQADGVLHLYELDFNGNPVEPGDDWTYPNAKITQIDRNPDFGDVRNYMFLAALKPISNLAQKNNPALPPDITPIMSLEQIDTTPAFAWARMYFKPLNGYFTEAELGKIAQKYKRLIQTFTWVGSTSIPGNASIKPYDILNDSFLIQDVSHTVDLVGKTFTTNLGLRSI